MLILSFAPTSRPSAELELLKPLLFFHCSNNSREKSWVLPNHHASKHQTAVSVTWEVGFKLMLTYATYAQYRSISGVWWVGPTARQFFFGCTDILMQKIRGNKSAEEFVSSHLTLSAFALSRRVGCLSIGHLHVVCNMESHYIILKYYTCTCR